MAHVVSHTGNTLNSWQLLVTNRALGPQTGARMNHQERWPLSGAIAHVSRGPGSITITLTGVITALDIEAVHQRLASEGCQRRTLDIDDRALWAVTTRSAAEAVLRGTPAANIGAGSAILVRVPPPRLVWALQLSAILMASAGWVVTPILRCRAACSTSATAAA